jgi:hypothetical protein
MPIIWGIVRRNPKFTPEASSIILFGPGVIEVVNANKSSDKMISKDIDIPVPRLGTIGGGPALSNEKP